MEVFKCLFYIWLLLADIAIAVTNVTVHPHLYQRQPSAGAISSNSLASTGTYSSCNLQVPSNISWPYFRELVANFTRVHVDLFRRDYRYTTFPLYLRDNFAPDLPPSSVTCDSVGECSLTSCQLLNPELSPYDRQMAYFVFEQISGIDHLFKSQREAMREGATYIDGQIPELIRTYSASPRIERQLQKKLMDRRTYEKLAMAIVGGAGLMAGGVMALPVFGIAATTGVAMTNLLTASYVSVVGSFNAVRPDPTHISSNLEDNIRSSLNEFRHAMVSNETFGMQSIMGHRPNTPGQDLVDVLAGEYFFRRDENIQQPLQESFLRTIFSTTLNGIWAQERSYIVQANVQTGYCEWDTRGPQENRACLPEHLNTVYYIYALDVSREYDHRQNDMALIHGPTGYRNFDSKSGRPTPQGITKEDIVRSAIFVHENKLQDAIRNRDFHTISEAAKRDRAMGKNLGEVPGGFSLPICVNPGGEAISSDWDKRARNYPCMCGNFGWNDGTWTYQADETEPFLVNTGLMYSEDWERFCHRNGECKGVEWDRLHERLDQQREPDDPQISKNLKHLFGRCKQDTEHGAGKPWYDFSSNPPLGRSVRDTFVALTKKIFRRHE
ncbi:hypothetical protein AA0112_g12328 [Alternaria arborescens]|nr:hypothetical protein AA0112_g12328 [Alternaria arborescens]